MHPARASRIFALLLLAAAALAPLHAEESPVAGMIQKEIQRLFDQHRQAIVRVRASDALGIRFGSGFFVDPAGTVYTHAGVVLKADDVVVNFQGRSIPAKVVASDTRTGIALLKTDCTSPFIPLGNSDIMEISAPVLAIGFPGDHDATPAIGLVAGRDFHQNGRQFSTSHLRMNMAVQPGYGGAPVLNFHGQVIGIVAARIDNGSSCHILPIRAAEKVRADIARFGELRPGWVGVEVEDAPERVEGSVARVVDMKPDTPAARFGLRKGDILLGINDSKIHSIQDLVDAAYFLTAGEEARIQICRNGEKMAIDVNPVLHPLAVHPPLRAESAVPVAQ
jgi:S1-C subfamily serine protease